MTKKDDVGYKKPPRHTQFKPGKSGNPAGRPKGKKNLKTLLEQRLRKTVTIVEKGRKKTVTMGEVVVAKLIADAAAGDALARRDLIRLMEGMIDKPETGLRIFYLDAEDQNV